MLVWDSYILSVSKYWPGFCLSLLSGMIFISFPPCCVSRASLLTFLETDFFILMNLWYPVISWCVWLGMLFPTSGICSIFSSGIFSVWSALGQGVILWICSILHWQPFAPLGSVPCSPPNRTPPPSASSQTYTRDLLSRLMDWVFTSYCFNHVLPQQLCSLL